MPTVHYTIRYRPETSKAANKTILIIVFSFCPDESSNPVQFPELVKDLGFKRNNASPSSVHGTDAANEARWFIFMISRSFKDHSKFNFTSITWSTDASTFRIKYACLFAKLHGRCQAPGESLKIGYKAGNWPSPSFLRSEIAAAGLT